jgi:predicted nucleic acid-binding protein
VSVFIVDASVVAKWFIDEEYGEAALSVLQVSNQLHAPDFLLLEMDSIICKWVRRGTVTPNEGRNVRKALRQYPIQHHSFVSLLDAAFVIADQTGQTIYDCLYLALSAALKGRMVTADRRLCDALKSGPFKKYVAWIGNVT